MPNGPVIDIKKCIGCKTCYDGCPTDVYAWDSEKKLPVVTYPDECNGCGACEYDCQQMAIMIQFPPWLRLTYAEKVQK